MMPQAFVMLTFGKYKGRALSEVPAGYLRWALNELGLEPELRAAMQATVDAHEQSKLAATWTVWRRPIDCDRWDRVQDVASEAEGSRLVQRLRDEGDDECAFAIVPGHVHPADELPDPPTGFVARPDGRRRRPASCCVVRRN